MNWLDTETKAILQQEYDPKLAPPKVGEFALVLLQKGADLDRLIRAVSRINECSKEAAVGVTSLPLPITINSGLAEAEALYGQFELICCDAVAAFIRSEVWQDQSNSEYMKALLRKVLRSPEFRSINLEVLEVPATESGQKFVDQFLGHSQWSRNGEGLPLSVRVPFKKARIMDHWAARIGAQVKCDAVQVSIDEAETP